MLAAALGSHRRGESGIDDDFTPRAANQPDKIVERHWPVVRITANEVFGRAPRVVRVLDRVDLVLRTAHVKVIFPNFRLPT